MQKNKNSYTFYDGLTRSRGYNEFLSQKIQMALGRNIAVNPMVESAQKAPGLFATNNDWKIVSLSLGFRANPQRYASQGINYQRDITNSDTPPVEVTQRELRENGFFNKVQGIISSIKRP